METHGALCGSGRFDPTRNVAHCRRPTARNGSGPSFPYNERRVELSSNWFPLSFKTGQIWKFASVATLGHCGLAESDCLGILGVNSCLILSENLGHMRSPNRRARLHQRSSSPRVFSGLRRPRRSLKSRAHLLRLFVLGDRPLLFGLRRSA